MVVSELRGEKIDIIPHNDEPARFVAKALSPARVREVLVDDDNKQATVVVPDDQLSLAIGKEGQNARLAARLTGWRVDIKSETEFAEDEDELGLERDEDMTGRCHAVLVTGRRCPNAALPGSRYCGLPAHQALAERDQSEVAAAEAPAEAEAPDAAAPEAQAPAEASAPAPEVPSTPEVASPEPAAATEEPAATEAAPDGDGPAAEQAEVVVDGAAEVDEATESVPSEEVSPAEADQAAVGEVAPGAGEAPVSSEEH
jgi:N utilization substance protein A